MWSDVEIKTSPKFQKLLHKKGWLFLLKSGVFLISPKSHQTSVLLCNKVLLQKSLKIAPSCHTACKQVTLKRMTSLFFTWLVFLSREMCLFVFSVSLISVSPPLVVWVDDGDSQTAISVTHAFAAGRVRGRTTLCLFSLWWPFPASFCLFASFSSCHNSNIIW